LREFAESAEAGVVDENVDCETFALQLIEKELWGGRLSEIQRIRPDSHSETLKFIRDLLSQSAREKMTLTTRAVS
jgi:hypothetical protein